MAGIDYDALAAQHGAIQPTIQAPQVNVTPNGYRPPWAGFSPKGTEEEKSKQWEEAQKRIALLRGMTNEAETKIPMLNKFGVLNRNTGTGGVLESIMPNTAIAQRVLHPEWMQQFGGGNQADINQMVAIQSKLGPAERAQGSGSSSDTDVNLFLRGLPNIGTTGDVNKDLRENYIRTYKNAIIKRDFLEGYLNQNGHLNGADQLWDKQKKMLGFDETADTSSMKNANKGGAAGVQIHGTYDARTGKIVK